MPHKKSLWNECCAEFLGTFLFVSVIVAVLTATKFSGANYGQWEIAVVQGFGLALAIYLTGGVSGAHLNPAVTIALAIFGSFNKRKIIPYIIAQFLGAFIAAAAVYALYNHLFDGKTLASAGVFATFPHSGISLTQAFFAEFFGTAILVGMIVGLSDTDNGVRHDALTPFLIGMTLAVCGSTVGPLTGFALNPARDFGPRLFTLFAGWGSEAMTGGLSVPYFWVPLIAPVLGGIVGAGCYTYIIGKVVLHDRSVPPQMER